MSREIMWEIYAAGFPPNLGTEHDICCQVLFYCHHSTFDLKQGVSDHVVPDRSAKRLTALTASQWCDNVLDI